MGEVLSKENKNRLADIPHGDFNVVIEKLAEERLPREPFERLAADYNYRREVVKFMCTGYNDLKKAEQAERDLQERRKHRRELPDSSYGAGQIEKFCKLAVDDTRTFVRIAAWSFAQSVSQKSEGHSPARQVFASEKLEELKQLLPPSKERNEGKDAVSVIADALVCACNSAVRHASDPNGYHEYAKETRHGGVGIGQVDWAKDQLGELVTVDPILFLQMVSVSFCKLLAGRSAKKICELHELLEKNYPLVHVYLSLEGCPEVDIGNVLHYYATHIAEWKSLQGSYPNPQEYFSLEFCCSGMKRLKDNPKQTHGTKGSLARGFARVLYNDNKADEEVWFPTCPFCNKVLYTPPGARLYDEKRDRQRLKVY